MEPCKAILKQPFISKEGNNCEQEINWSQDGTDNNDWCKGGCECKLTATFAESLYLLLRLKPRSAKRLSRHSAFMGKWPTLS